jgi:hypothetical protein
MKKIIDIIQVMMTDDSLLGWLTWAGLFLVIFQGFKIIGYILGLIGSIWDNRSKILLKARWSTVIIAGLFALFAWIFRYQINDQVQYIEQVYLKPIYLNSDTSYWSVSIYEQELKKHTSEYEFQITKEETAHMAFDVKSSPLAIYEVNYSECGMNPFAVNINEFGDTVAVGWIQLTTNGIKDIKVDGHDITWKEVKSWVPTRNIRAMMEASRQYLITRAAGRPLPTSTDVYIAVFAPSFIGYSDAQTLYSISSWPQAYIQNKGLDGYGLVGDKIVKGRMFMDGKITVQDMRLHLALKKAKFLKA